MSQSEWSDSWKIIGSVATAFQIMGAFPYNWERTNLPARPRFSAKLFLWLLLALTLILLLLVDKVFWFSSELQNDDTTVGVFIYTMITSVFFAGYFYSAISVHFSSKQLVTFLYNMEKSLLSSTTNANLTEKNNANVDRVTRYFLIWNVLKILYALLATTNQLQYKLSYLAAINIEVVTVGTLILFRSSLRVLATHINSTITEAIVIAEQPTPLLNLGSDWLRKEENESKSPFYHVRKALKKVLKVKGMLMDYFSGHVACYALLTVVANIGCYTVHISGVKDKNLVALSTLHIIICNLYLHQSIRGYLNQVKLTSKKLKNVINKQKEQQADQQARPTAETLEDPSNKKTHPRLRLKLHELMMLLKDLQEIDIKGWSIVASCSFIALCAAVISYFMALIVLHSKSLKLERSGLPSSSSSSSGK